MVESVESIPASLSAARGLRRVLVASFVVVATLAVAGSASSASRYSDGAGDDNAAPDITSVVVTESVDGMLDVSVAVANYEALPPSSWFNLWFDLDGDTETGDSAGDDALVRFDSDGSVQLRRWVGEEFVTAAPDGITAGFAAGVLTVRVPAASLGELTMPGILVVAVRSSVVATETLTTADFMPENGRSRWTRQGRTELSDAEGDHDAAPDITTIDVSDARDGWIRFAISTPNRPRLPDKAIVAVSIDRDARPATGDSGAEVTLTTLGGEIQLERWDAATEEWRPDRLPTRARVSGAEGIVFVDVHQSELDGVARFGFRVVSADLNPLTGSLVAIDFAPDNGAFWRYSLTNAAAVRLVAGRATGSPAAPRAGKRFTIRTPVRRSDNDRAITSGSVKCNVRVNGSRVRAAGRLRAGRGLCELVVPAKARVVSGSMTIRSTGRTVTSRFSFRVR